MGNHNINIIYDSKHIAYNNDKYLYANMLNYNRAIIEYVNEEGNVERDGKLYYLIKNNTDISVYKPMFYNNQNDVLHIDKLPVCYKKIENINDLKPISDCISLFSYPELHKDSKDINFDVDNKYYQDIVLTINVNGGNNDIKVGNFEKYSILNNNGIYHKLDEYDNSLTIKSVKNVGENAYEIHIINYGKIEINDNIYYLLPIYNSDNLSVYCKVKFSYNIDKIKTYNAFVRRKIDIANNADNKYNLLINKKNIFSNGTKTIDILKINSINGKHSIIIDNNNDWIHCNIINNINNENNSFYDIEVTIDKNLMYQDRIGYIKIIHSDSNEVSKIIEIKQKTNINSYDKFIDIHDEFIFNWNEGKKDFKVELFPFIDCEFKVLKHPNWVDVKINGNVLTLICKKNKFGKREAYIELCNTDFPLNPITKLIKQNGRF